METITQVAVLIPTRGLLFTAVTESVEQNLCAARKEYETVGMPLFYYMVKYTEDKPIPECCEYLAEYALGHGATHLWFVEEDTVPPPFALVKMLEADKDYVAIDYPVGDGISTSYRLKDRVAWTGLGCTLIKAKVFESIEPPYFTTGNTIEIHSRGVLESVDRPCPYGGHDINLGVRLVEAGFELSVLPGLEAKHLRLEGLGERYTNNGCHSISVKKPISRQAGAFW